jgi:hypothetical protein
MTFFFFDQFDDEAVIITDTLVTDTSDRPLMFQTKVWPLPHLNMVMAVTGTADVGKVWYQALTSRPTPPDVNGLDAFAGEALRGIYAELTALHGDLGSSTVFHFGFPVGSPQLVRYTYRSMQDFESDRQVGPAWGIKPQPVTFEPEYPTDVDGYIALAARVRAENDSGTVGQSVRIGGELIATQITNGDIRFKQIARFEDYDEHAHAIATLLNRTEQS